MIRLLFLLFLILTFAGCNPDDLDLACFAEPCNSRLGYAIIDKSTFDNLMGTDGQRYHPDSIRITSNTGNKIFYDTGFGFGDNWTFSFNYHDALQRCDLQETDSIFSLFFYLYLNVDDTDTLEFRIAPCRDFDAIFFNGSPEVFVPPGTHEYTSLFLRK